MGMPDVKIVPISSIGKGAPSNRSLDFSQRESQEIVVGISGAVGSGTEYVVSQLKLELERLGYEVVTIKISSMIDGLLRRNLVSNWDKKLDSANRYEKLQAAGNLLRKHRRTDFLAELAIAAISLDRNRRPTGEDSAIPVPERVPTRVAYVIDQLKHPDEVGLLRTIYSNLFYLVGVFASEKQRTSNLEKSLTPVDAKSVMQRDRREEDTDGQQLDKTLRLADFFVRNNQHSNQSIQKPLERFLALVHGAVARTPTKDEYAMYAAFSAGLRSACLSRQVGAAITNGDGEVIATGCNDVPKAFGGLYTEDDGANDFRCANVEGGKCFNDENKDALAAEIQELLREHSVDESLASTLVKEIRADTRLKDLIEFSRSVHAEMDALTSLARKGGPGSLGGRLYTTTYPCHNCARHIIAAGVKEVYYVEPYEKSLALKLHFDAIADDEEAAKKVRFLHFEGVAPRQYQALFLAPTERKKAGKVVRPTPQPSKTRPQFLDSYVTLESKVVESLKESQGLSEDQIVELSAPRT